MSSELVMFILIGPHDRRTLNSVSNVKKIIIASHYAKTTRTVFVCLNFFLVIFLFIFLINILLTVLFVSSYYCFFFLELMVNFVIVTPYLKCSACFTRSVGT
jgi:hypothetical protein